MLAERKIAPLDTISGPIDRSMRLDYGHIAKFTDPRSRGDRWLERWYLSLKLSLQCVRSLRLNETIGKPFTYNKAVHALAFQN